MANNPLKNPQAGIKFSTVNHTRGNLFCQPSMNKEGPRPHYSADVLLKGRPSLSQYYDGDFYQEPVHELEHTIPYHTKIHGATTIV